MALPNLGDYHVGWICALPPEFAAGKAMFDEAYDKYSDGSNSYALGRIHHHKVVMVCLPVAVDGTNAAVDVAANMLRTFKALKFALLVGIGGGIPNIEKGIDIRLGDIVVSQPSRTNGGVIQYDKGKSLGDGSFERKGQLNMPPTLLLKALSSLQADHEMDESMMSHYLTDMVEKYPKMLKNGYSYPGQEKDSLMCTECDGGSTHCRSCRNGVVNRAPRRHQNPEIHYGVIASGNRVIKNATERDQIRDDNGAICVEMEAAGLMNYIPSLVIRGICDYADSAKNDDWHKYAAATAAAFAKEVLLYVSAEQADHEGPMKQISGE